MVNECVWGGGSNLFPNDRGAAAFVFDFIKRQSRAFLFPSTEYQRSGQTLTASC